jgi:hypothetical protein
MNLGMNVLRLLAVRAIRGNTWAEERVYDSPATPADIRVQTNRETYIAVYVDSGDANLKDNTTLTAPGSADLVIEVGVASPQRFDQAGNPVGDETPAPRAGSTVTQLNATDEGMEMTIGLVAHQAMQALVSTKATNPWAELFRMLTVAQYENLSIRRGGPVNETPNKPTPRFASRIVIIRCGMIADPPRGVPMEPGTFWPTFLDATKDDPELAGVSSLIRAHIEPPTGALPDWRQAQKLLTLTNEGAHSLGMAPLRLADDPVGPEEQVELQTVNYGPAHPNDPWEGIPL